MSSHGPIDGFMSENPETQTTGQPYLDRELAYNFFSEANIYWISLYLLFRGQYPTIKKRSDGSVRTLWHIIPMFYEEPEEERSGIEIFVLYSSFVLIVVVTNPHGVEDFLDLLIKDMAQPQTFDGINHLQLSQWVHSFLEHALYLFLQLSSFGICFVLGQSIKLMYCYVYSIKKILFYNIQKPYKCIYSIFHVNRL